MSGIPDVSGTVVEGSGGIEAGDTRTGVITGAQTYTVTHSDGESEYFELQIDDENVPFEYSPSYPLNGGEWSLSSSLGQLLSRFGADMTIDNQVSIADHIQVGDRVEFEVEEESWTGDDGDERTSLVADNVTVRPEGEPAPDVSDSDDTESSGESSESSGGVTLSDDARDILSEHDGDSVSDVEVALAKANGDLHTEFKEAKREGCEFFAIEKDSSGTEYVQVTE